jgi:hypothetical protein
VKIEIEHAASEVAGSFAFKVRACKARSCARRMVGDFFFPAIANGFWVKIEVVIPAKAGTQFRPSVKPIRPLT